MKVIKFAIGTLFFCLTIVLCSGMLAAQDDQSTKFYLVGLGPGDPELLTLRAVNVIQQADVIFCRKQNVEMLGDQLKGKELHFDYWRLFPFYGASEDSITEQQMAEYRDVTSKRTRFVQLVRDAIAQGKTVAVLDMGDPLVYGPSSWTLEEFEDLKPKVVPGISAFNAGNAALKKSVTIASRTKSVTLTAADWMGTEDTIEKLSASQNSMVLFTMRAEFRDFIERLALKYPAETPIALVLHAGDSKKERVIESTIGKALQDINAEELPFEYIIYVGDFLKHRYRAK